jgi:uncharacterized protein (DUF1015 family)
MTDFSDDLVRPFAGLRAAPARASEIAAPPYDVINADEARELAKNKPYSFLHISRAEIDLPHLTDPYADEVYAQAARNLQSFEAQGLLVRDHEPHFYIYRMRKAQRSQTGVALSASIEAYRANRIRKHELTRPAKEDDRVRQIDSVDAITGPVLLVHRHESELSTLIAQLSERPADVRVPDVDDVEHELWCVSDLSHVDKIAELFNRMEALYIADGHHRSAAAARIADKRRAENPNHTGAEPYNGFLAIAFPDNEVTILDYNRVVVDLNNMSEMEFLSRLKAVFNTSFSDGPVKPSAANTFGMYLAGNWYAVKPKRAVNQDDPVERLDVRVLDTLVLDPILGINNQRIEPRIDFVGGSRGPEAIAERVDSGEMAVGFTLYPTSLADLMSVADAGEIMPPKSTWFDPKLADGLISLPLR